MTLEIDNGVVIYLDALGISKYTDTAQFLDFICEIKKMKIRAQYVWNKWKDKFEKEEVMLPDPKIAIFQDSIIICFPDKVKKDNTLHNFFAAQNWLMAAYFVAIEKGLFFRGAISCGEYIYDETEGGIAVLGAPVVEAINYEKKGDWIGVIQTDYFQEQYMKALVQYASAHKLDLEDVVQGYNRFYVKYEVPIKDNRKSEHYVVNWPTIWKSVGTDILKTFLTKARDETENGEDKKKYDNTIDFVKYCEKHRFFLQ